MNKYMVIIFIVCLIVIFCIYMIWMPGKSYQGDLSPLSEEERTLKDNLKTTVSYLSETIGPRHVFVPQKYQQTIDFISNTLIGFGYTINKFPVNAEHFVAYNIEAILQGSTQKNEIIIVGAHYDSVALDNCPAANDNGTGVAVVLELAKLFKDIKTDRTIHFVLFPNEEPPFFKTKYMGSYHYAEKLRKQDGANVKAMFSLETMGYFSSQRNSQNYPFPLNFIYPDQGNFIAFVSNVKYVGLTRTSIQSFRKHTKFPSEGIGMLSFIPGISWSDQWSFWQQGYPALMITDTAFYRYPYYHTKHDRLHHLDFDKLARVTMGLKEMLKTLGKNTTPL